MDFSSAAELLKICQASGIPISQAMIDRETLYLGADTVTTYSRMEHSYEIMKNAVHSAVTEDIRSIGGLIGGEAKKMDAYRASTEKPLCGSVISKAIGYAMGVLEVNASMGLIVAAPTAGSSGVIPGVFVALQESMASPMTRWSVPCSMLVPSATSSPATPPLLAPRADARLKWVLPAPWLPLPLWNSWAVLPNSA